MDKQHALRLAANLPDSALVLDVGGGATAFPRANHVLDVRSWDQREMRQGFGIAPRYSKETWKQWDVCSRELWPFPDKHFDFVVCSHLLEDVRDPIWVCSELSRVAKAGYIETPSRVVEQSLGVEHPQYAGYYHHRWLVEEKDGALIFRAKPHSLHTHRHAIVTKLGAGQTINPAYSIVSMEWKDHLPASELLTFAEDEVLNELSSFASHARKLDQLVVTREIKGAQLLRRKWFYLRLRAGYY